jgi:hypothetical protein
MQPGQAPGFFGLHQNGPRDFIASPNREFPAHCSLPRFSMCAGNSADDIFPDWEIQPFSFPRARIKQL